MKPEYASVDEMKSWADRVMMSRAPDYTIGELSNPYMRRWWLVPRNAGPNVYLHEILRDDDDRAGHDHPWDNTTLIIDGEYEEVRYRPSQPWVEFDRVTRRPGDTVFRRATDTHRLIVPQGGRVISLFTTGPKVRDWGFWCPGGRWVPWQKFTAGEHGELVGRGCE